jgi:gliding motility-associated-like protein
VIYYSIKTSSFWFVFLSAFICIGRSNGQAPAPNFQWAVNNGGVYSDKAQSVCVDNLGNVISTGYFSGTVDFDPGTNIFNLTSNSSDIYIQKLDPNGNLIWAISTSNNGTGVGVGKSITVDDNGNIYATGNFSGSADFDPSLGVYNLTSNGSMDVFIIKISSSGNLLWAQSYGNANYDEGVAIELDNNNNIQIIGGFCSTIDFDFGPGVRNFTSKSIRDIFNLKLDSSGNYIWANTIGNKFKGGCFGNSISIDNNGYLYTVGYFRETMDFDPNNGISNHTANNSDWGGFVQKLDSIGNYQWANVMTGQLLGIGGCYPYSTKADQYSNVITVGDFSGTIDFDPSTNTALLNGNGSSDIFIQKTDSSGNLIWAKAFGGIGEDHCYSTTTDLNGNIYLTGFFSNTVDFDPGQGTYNVAANSNFINGSAIFILKLDANGSFQWVQTLPNQFPQVSNFGNCIKTDTIGNIYVAGDFNNNVDFNPTNSFYYLQSNGNNDAFVLKLGQPIISPTSSLTVNTNSICKGACVNFTNQSTLDSTWQWLFPGGTPASSTLQTPPQVCYNTPGNYSVTLITSNAFGSDTLTLTNYITVDPTPTAQINTNISTCEGTVVNLTSSGGTSYSWLGPNGFTSNSQNPTITNSTVTNSGTYSVVVANSVGCTDTASTQLTINAATQAVANSNSPLCAGQTLNLTANTASSYSWAGPNGFTSSLQNPTISNLSNNNSGTYTLIVANGNGCADTTTLSISVLANNPVSINSNGPLCEGQILNLTASAGTSYAWSGPNGFTSNLQNPTINNVAINNAGSYAVVVTNSNGCTNSASLTVSINPNTPVTASSNSPICEGDNLTMNVSAGSSYSWTGPNGFTSSIQNPIITNITTASSGLYSVTVTNACGTGTSNTQVQVGQKPTAGIAVTQTVICEGDTVYLTANGGNSYYWYGPNSFNSILSNPTVNNFSGANAGAYYLVATNTDNCSDTTVVNLTLNESTCFFIPSVFTPNNDGTNDTWVIEGMWQFPNCVVKVYNRWGQSLFESKGYASPWDGTFEGNECPIADYYYIIDLKNGSKVFTGTVTIKR